MGATNPFAVGNQTGQPVVKTASKTYFSKLIKNISWKKNPDLTANKRYNESRLKQKSVNFKLEN